MASVMPDPATATPDQARVAMASAAGVASVDHAGQAAANKWMQAFSKTTGAWGACLTILSTETDARLQFYACNVLLSKVRGEWGRLEPAARMSLLGALMKPLQTAAAAAAGGSASPGGGGGVPLQPLALTRLCQVVGAASALTGDEALNGFLAHAFSLAAPGTASPASVRLALDLLSGLAAETLTRPHVNRGAVVAAVGKHMAHLVELVEAVVPGGASGDAGKGGIAAAAFKCLRNYLESGITLAALHTHREGRLLKLLLQALGSPDEETLQAAADTLVDLLGHAASIRFPARRRGAGGGGGDTFVPAVTTEEANNVAAAIVTVAAGVAAQASRFRKAVAESDAEVCRFLCRVIVGIGEAAVDYLAAGDETGQVLVDMLLECSQHEDTNVAELAMEFWPKLQMVPASSRAESLRAPLFRRVLERVLRGSTYPEDVAEWKSGDMDDFHQYREVLCVDALEACFVELEEGFVEYCGGMLQHAGAWDGGWETAEVVLFATRAAALQIKSFLRRKPDASDPMLAEHQAAVQTFLTTVFTAIASHATVVTCHFAVVQSGARCVHMYGAWVAAHEDLLSGVVGYTLKGLLLQPAAEYSAVALSVLCSRCARQFANVATVDKLVTAVEQGTAAGMPLSARKASTETVARLAARLPASDMLAALQRLLSPVLTNIMAVGDAAVDRATCGKAASELQVFAAAIRFAEVSRVATGSEHPAVALLKAAWPACEKVATKFGGQAKVVAGLCATFSAATTCAQHHAASLLPTMCNAAVAMFKAHRHVCCLDFLGVAVQVFGPAAAPGSDSLSVLHSLLMSVATPVFDLLRASLQSSKLREAAPTLRGLWDLVHLYLTFCPAAVLVAPLLEQLVQAATACCALQEKYAIRSVCAFFKAVLGFNPASLRGAAASSAAALGEAVRATVQAQGSAAAQALLYAAADTMPPAMYDAMAMALMPIVQRYPAVMQSAVVAALSSSDFPGKAEAWTDAGKDMFVRLLAAAPGVDESQRPAIARGGRLVEVADTEAWFTGLFGAFARISRGQASVDELSQFAPHSAGVSTPTAAAASPAHAAGAGVAAGGASLFVPGGAP